MRTSHTFHDFTSCSYVKISTYVNSDQIRYKTRHVHSRVSGRSPIERSTNHYYAKGEIHVLFKIQR